VVSPQLRKFRILCLEHFLYLVVIFALSERTSQIFLVFIFPSFIDSTHELRCVGKCFSISIVFQTILGNRSYWHGWRSQRSAELFSMSVDLLLSQDKTLVQLKNRRWVQLWWWQFKDKPDKVDESRGILRF